MQATTADTSANAGPAWPKSRRSNRYIAALFVWTIISTGLILLLNLGPGHPNGRATILMGAGLVLIWVVVGGLMMYRFRDRVRAFVPRLPGHWTLKFVLFCTLMALLEEAVTVAMTNLAPVFGVPVGKAYITASANYFDVVLFHSVIVFVPWFVAWAWMLSRWDFHPNAVFLVFGVTGTLAEAGYGGWPHLIEYGMWTFVYGLMVYLPAYAIPRDRPARPVPGWLYPLAVVIPLPFMILLAPWGFVWNHFHGGIDKHFPPILPGS